MPDFYLCQAARSEASRVAQYFFIVSNEVNEMLRCALPDKYFYFKLVPLGWYT